MNATVKKVQEDLKRVLSEYNDVAEREVHNECDFTHKLLYQQSFRVGYLASAIQNAINNLEAV